MFMNLRNPSHLPQILYDLCVLGPAVPLFRSTRSRSAYFDYFPEKFPGSLLFEDIEVHRAMAVFVGSLAYLDSALEGVFPQNAVINLPTAPIDHHLFAILEIKSDLHPEVQPTRLRARCRESPRLPRHPSYAHVTLTSYVIMSEKFSSFCNQFNLTSSASALPLNFMFIARLDPQRSPSSPTTSRIRVFMIWCGFLKLLSFLALISTPSPIAILQ